MKWECDYFFQDKEFLCKLQPRKDLHSASLVKAQES